METVRRCKGCEHLFSQNSNPRNLYDYCEVCRKEYNGKGSIEYQMVMKGLPNGKYVVMQCDYVGMIGNELSKTELVGSAMDGCWPEGMLVFNMPTREVYEIVGKELKTQHIVSLAEIPEIVSKRIESSHPPRRLKCTD